MALLFAERAGLYRTGHNRKERVMYNLTFDAEIIHGELNYTGTEAPESKLVVTCRGSRNACVLARNLLIANMEENIKKQKGASDG